MHRRQFLATTSAFAAATLIPLSGHANALVKPIKTGFGKVSLMGAGNPMTDVMAYDAQVPGPTLKIQQGHRSAFRLTNNLDQPTSTHWHGIRLENAMDGVPGLTQEPIQPGESFDYSFVAPDAGTYWYHSHLKSWEQVTRGLYGALIVKETVPVDVDTDRLFIADDWRLDDNGQIAGNFGHMRDASHGGRLGNWLTVNSQTKPFFNVRPGERIRLRCISAANARIMAFSFPNVVTSVVAIDGQPLASPSALMEPLLIAPAQRADLIIDVPIDAPAELMINEVSTGEPLTAAIIAVSGQPVRNKLKEPGSLILPPNPLPHSVSTADALSVELRMEGGAMGQLHEASYQGQMYDLRTLVLEKGKAWTFNGEAGMTVEPLFKSAHGRSVTVNMINDTRWPHAMHIHGHHFQVIARNGDKVDGAPWRDTELIEPGDSARIAFVADNPGKWLMHCHMLEHHMAGMGTWFEVGLPS